MSDTLIPQNLKYTTSHEWIQSEGDVVTLGITDHAQHELGDIVFVELPEVGQAVEAGKGVAVIEAVKTVADVYAPAAGEVVEVNTVLADDAGSINRDAYGSWIVKIRLTGSLPGDLLDADGYKAQL
ncbi:MAG: glycine cleavage system protein GcvH [Fibrobacterota bacterium]|nr:MAG: glycine cleavage system protein GcvH [Fibrobacterota bacterium]